MRKDMCKRAGVFTILLFLLCAGCRKPAVFYEDGMQEVQKAEQEEEKKEVTGKTEAPICVYVCGEVENQGVYELPSQSRIGDAVEAAGGMTEDA